MLNSCALLIAASLAVGQAAESPSNFEHLKALDFLTGTWTTNVTLPGEDASRERLLTFEWILNKNVQLLTLTEQESVLAKQMVLWDAAANQMKTFMATSEGAYSQGTLVVKGDQLIFKQEGANAKGEKTSSTIVYKKKTDDHFVVESKDGMAGGEPREGWTVEIKRVKKPATDAR